MKDDTPRQVMKTSKNSGKQRAKTVYRSNHLGQYLGQEVEYPESLYDAITGKKTGCCSCCY